MEAALATAVATAGIKILVEKLMDVLKKEYSRLFRSLKGDLENLQKTLRMIEAYLSDADNKAITQQLVKIWLSDLEGLAFDADNVLDELNYHLLRKKIKKSKIYEVPVSPIYRILRKHKMARTIKKINANFEFMTKRAADLGIHNMVANATVAAPVSFETDSFSQDPIFIGRDDDVTKLVSMLTQTHPEVDKRKFSIVALVGMGGMGKTTLTREVSDRESVKDRFGSPIWVHVSQIFDPIILFKKILSALPSHGGGDEGHTKEATLRKLQEALRDKTYLLVLDYVWNEDVPMWDDFMNSMSGVTSTMGNGIIITTRSHKFEIIGKEIAKACRGLPLAANVIGGVLRRYKSEEEWRSISENCLSDAEGAESIQKILKLSFDYLPSPSLKKCFAYCSIFPKGRWFMKQQVIEQWMAEGFLQPYERNEMEDVGNKFFNVLLHNSLLQDSWQNEDRNVEAYWMHDLVHDLASSVLSYNNANCSTLVRYKYVKQESSHISKEVAKHLRTLILKGGTSGINFSGFQCLHNLTIGKSYKEH
ncbi:putative disease resistance protein RGA1 [Salvia hispanica]|uniref:putative disease resistance protein RGA1 n=1 Tax=Salvia hispanica TaxID=49212 RepID=UPI0020091755|nr:putative disease resistance protein RGA1 [Salvia hispanica]